MGGPAVVRRGVEGDCGYSGRLDAVTEIGAETFGRGYNCRRVRSQMGRPLVFFTQAGVAHHWDSQLHSCGELTPALH